MPATTAEPEPYRIEIKRVRRALAQPLQTGGGHCIAVRESVLLKVTAGGDSARTGYGEAATLPWFGTESANEAADALAALGNKLQLKAVPQPDKTAEAEPNKTAEEQPPATPDASAQHSAESRTRWQDTLAQRLPDAAAIHLDSAPCARWALECALRQAGELPPLSAPQGVPSALQQKAIPTAAIPVAALLPAGSAAVPQSLLTAGFRVFKTKIGVRSFNEEAASVTALLGSLQQHAATGKYTGGSDTSGNAQMRRQAPLKVRLDANGSLLGSALHAWLALLTPFGEWVDFIEQPLPVGQEAQTAAAFTGSPLAFAFDESLTSLPQLQQVSAQFPQAVLVVKPSLLGSAEGFLKWRLHECRPQQGNAGNSAHRPRRIVYSSALETGIGLHHALSLAAADPLPLEPVGFGTGNLFAQDGLGAPPGRAATIAFTEGMAPVFLSEAAGNTKALAHKTSSTADNSTATQRLRTEMEALWKRV